MFRTALWLGIFIVASLGIALVFVLYPLALAIAGAVSGKRFARSKRTSLRELPSVSVIVVVRNAERHIEAKIKNALEIDYPEDKYEILVFSDGSTDRTEAMVQSFADSRLLFLKSENHQGKIHGLNQAVGRCSGDILVFSDGDALLRADAIKKLVGHYSDPQIGGVGGQKVIREDAAGLRGAQALYVRLDSTIKRLESALGSITSNDGKLYSVRRSLFEPIPPATADDLCCCLTVVSHGKRFIFEPEAVAAIPAPSRNPGHELQRRRRIVCGSLVAMVARRRVFNPLSFGLYGLRLGINKIVRRLLPLNLILFLVSGLVLWHLHWIVRVVVSLQVLFYVTALSYPLLLQRLQGDSPVRKVSQAAFYVCVGTVGTLLGLWDFVRGRRFEKWEPKRSGAIAGGKGGAGG